MLIMAWKSSLIWTGILTFFASTLSEGRPSDDAIFDALKESFSSYTNDNGFRGGTVGVLKNNKLLFAEGTGQIKQHDARSWSVLPILDISKTITAVAILQLVEQNLLRLDRNIFGTGGVLYYMRPDDEDAMNPRLTDITIEHLLRHTGGWDEVVGPVYDPMLNAFFLRQGYNVVDIGKEMKSFGILTQDDIIRYMLAQPLQFEPGTAVRHSNFGYCILGRVIEEVADLPYEEYVKKNILEPAGMWHTRLSPAMKQQMESRKWMALMSLTNKKDKSHTRGDKNNGHFNVFDIIPAPVLDSTLGWHSNVYDLARFFTMLFSPPTPGKGLIESLSITKLFLEKPADPIFSVDSDMWGGIGFTVKQDGTYWLEAFHQHIGVNLMIYHQGSPSSSLHVDSDMLSLYEYMGFPLSAEDDTTVIFLGDSKRRHSLHNGLPNIFLPPYGLSIPQNQKNAYLQDLADIVTNLDGHQISVLYKMSEHTLKKYSNAMRLAGYFPKWIHGYKYDGNSYFLAIFEEAKVQQQLDFTVAVYSDKDRAITYIAQQVKAGYQLTFLQSYHSFSRDNRPAHVVIMSKPAGKLVVEFDIDASIESYKDALDEAVGDQFYPVIQSIETRKAEHQVTFLMQKLTENDPHTLAYNDLNLDQLETLTKDDSKEDFMLVYLDSYHEHGEAKFSAVFKKQTLKKSWMMETDMKMEDLNDEIAKWEGYGYLLNLLVAYNRDDDLKFIGFWTAP